MDGSPASVSDAGKCSLYPGAGLCAGIMESARNALSGGFACILPNCD